MRTTVQFTRLPQRFIACHGEPGQRPELSDVRLGGILHVNVSFVPQTRHEIPYKSSRRRQSPQRLKHKLPILIQPRPHLVVDVRLVRLDEVPLTASVKPNTGSASSEGRGLTRDDYTPPSHSPSQPHPDRKPEQASRQNNVRAVSATQRRSWPTARTRRPFHDTRYSSS